MKKRILYIATLMLAMTSVAFAESDDVTAMRLTFNNNVRIVPEGLSDASPEGTVGMLNGREAIVVDLGGTIGKVAIATVNAGGTAPYGRLFYYSNAINPEENGLTDGWYIPSKDEMDALKDRLTWAYPIPYQGELLAGGIISVNEMGTSLFLPAAGYYYNNNTVSRGSTCAYWTSTTFNSSRTYKLEMNSSSKTVDDGANTAGRSIRPFCALPKVKNLTAPIEREHMLEVSSITNTSDGIRLTVNGQSVEYPFEMLKEMTFFNGTPVVAVSAEEDSENAGNYYATFYSGLEAYNIPEGVKAYTANIENDVVRFTEIEDGVLPQGEGVLLYSDTTSDITMTMTKDNGGKSSDNIFDGVDIGTEQDGTANYMLTYDQNKMGFYKMNSSVMLSPNKAFIKLSSSNPAESLHVLLPSNIATGIEQIENGELTIENSAIYNLNGVRLSKLQRGINIVGSKKVLVR